MPSIPRRVVTGHYGQDVSGALGEDALGGLPYDPMHAPVSGAGKE